MGRPFARTALAGLTGGALWVAFPFGTLALDTRAPAPAASPGSQ